MIDTLKRESVADGFSVANKGKHAIRGTFQGIL